MLFENTTDLSDTFLRGMLRWTCRQVGFKYASLTRATFTNTDCSGRGRAWLYDNRILVRSSPVPTRWPYSWLNHRGQDLYFRDRLAIIVYITGHELQHLVNWNTWMPDGFRLDAHLRRSHDLERHCVRIGKKVLETFEKSRLSLSYSWGG